MDIREFNKPEAKGTVNTQVPTQKTANVSTELIAPVDEMLEYIKEEGLTEQDVFTILDSILTSGTVTWTFKLFNRIPVTFKMRPMWVNEMLVKALEDDQPKTVALFSEVVAKYNMAGSLIQFGDKQYDVSTKDNFYVQLNTIGELSYPIYAILVKQLSLFDRLVSLATSNWAVENFTKPPLDESAQK